MHGQTVLGEAVIAVLDEEQAVGSGGRNARQRPDRTTREYPQPTLRDRGTGAVGGRHQPRGHTHGGEGQRQGQRRVTQPVQERRQFRDLGMPRVPHLHDRHGDQRQQQPVHDV